MSEEKDRGNEAIDIGQAIPTLPLIGGRLGGPERRLLVAALPVCLSPAIITRDTFRWCAWGT